MANEEQLGLFIKSIIDSALNDVTYKIDHLLQEMLKNYDKNN